MEMEPQIDPTEILREFLDDIVQSHPDELVARLRTLQNAWVIIKNQVRNTQALATKLQSHLKTIEDEMEYLKLSITKLADTATKITVVAPMIDMLRQKRDEARGDE